MNTTSIVVPDTDHRNGDLLAEVHRDCVVFSRRERSQPHVHVIVGEVVSIDQILHDARVIAVPWQYVDVRWTSTDLLHVDLLSVHIVNFDTGQSQVIHVAPRCVYVEPELAT